MTARFKSSAKNRRLKLVKEINFSTAQEIVDPKFQRWFRGSHITLWNGLVYA